MQVSKTVREVHAHFFLSFMTVATSQFTIRFHLRNFPSSHKIGLTGSIPELGMWQEEFPVPMDMNVSGTESFSLIPLSDVVTAIKFRFIAFGKSGLVKRDMRRVLVVPQDILTSSDVLGCVKLLINVECEWGAPTTTVSLYVPSEQVPDGSRGYEMMGPQIATLLGALRDLRREKELLKADVFRMSTELFNQPGLMTTLESKIGEMSHNKVIKDLLTDINELKGKVKVVARVRPLIEGEHYMFPFTVVNPSTIVVRADKGYEDNGPFSAQSVADKQFGMDEIFDERIDNFDFYEKSRIKSIIESSVLIANNVCIFAYGQTNSGKSHTVLGSRGEKGIVELAIDSVFSILDGPSMAENANRVVTAEMLEIYRENVYSLIHPFEVDSKDDLLNVFKSRIKERATASTNMNSTSSRSHCVFTITLVDPNTQASSTIYLVDLAGSERTKVSGAEGDRLSEANAINKSLSTLGLVLNALANRKPFIPYRDSKLTKLLAPVFTISNPPSKVVMVANLSPCERDERESVSTLAFAQRVGLIELRDGADTSDVLNRKIDKLNRVIEQQGRELSSLKGKA